MLYNKEGTYGHAYLSLGSGKAASTDILRRGKVDLVPIKLIADRWFGGVKPYYVDPVYFQYAGGSTGMKAPTVAAVKVFPLKPGERKAQVSQMKLRFNWTNKSAKYGTAFAVRIVKWQKNHSVTPNGVVTKKQYRLILSR